MFQQSLKAQNKMGLAIPADGEQMPGLPAQGKG
jgi:hypothetical protein